MKDRICRLMEKIAKEAAKRGYDSINCYADNSGYINWFTTTPSHLDFIKYSSQDEWRSRRYDN